MTSNNTCDENEYEDEKQVVFKCRLYDTCRAKYARLFFTASNLKEFLDKNALAKIFWNVWLRYVRTRDWFARSECS